MRRFTTLSRRFGIGQRRGGASWRVVAAVVAIAAVGAVAYKVLFDRPGELAIGMLPADAQLILTVDLTPSPAQAATFKAIGDALREEGLLDELEKGIAEAAALNELVAELRPHIGNSFAIGVWGIREGNEPEYAALLISVKDPTAVRASLVKHLRSYRVDGEQVFVIDKQPTAAVLDSYLVLSANEETMRRLIAVRSGSAPSAADLVPYREARKSLPDDANVMLFVSNSLLREAGKEAERQLGGANPFRHSGWFAAGLTIRGEGLLCSVRAPFSASEVQEMQPLAKLPILRLDALRLLPRGAYGLVALSQPSALYDTIQNFAQRERKSRLEMQEGLREFRRAIGIDFERDVVPAFRGEFTVAIYPSRVPGTDDPEAVFVADASNGADPVGLVEKLRQTMESGRFDQEWSAPRFQERSFGDTKIYFLDLSDDPNAKGKTLSYAVVGKSVVVCTSLSLLEEIVSIRSHEVRSLAADPRFERMASRARESSRFTLMADLPTIAEAAAEYSGTEQWDWQGLFGDEGFTYTAAYDGKIVTAEWFMPLNWVEAIRRLGAEARKQAGTFEGAGAAW